MMGLGFGSMMLFGGVAFAAFCVLVLGGAVWLVATLARGAAPQTSPTPPGQSPLDAAKARYAMGEISRPEYEQIRRDLGN